jgi:hypothetical protein
MLTVVVQSIDHDQHIDLEATPFNSVLASATPSAGVFGAGSCSYTQSVEMSPSNSPPIKILNLGSIRAHQGTESFVTR